MNLTVHMGTTKTGSTSIQAFLNHNREALAAKGICVPLVLGAQDHRKAAIASLNFGQSLPLMKGLGVTNAEELARFSKETAHAYRELLAAHAPSEVVISSEHLQSRLSVAGNVERFRDLFATGFEKVRILIYVRPQLDQLVSLYSTTLRAGNKETLDEYVHRHTVSLFKYFDIRGLILNWAKVFGMENIHVRAYKDLPPRSQAGATADFCRFIGQSYADPAFVVPPSLNASINAEGQEKLRLLNVKGGLTPIQLRQAVLKIEKELSGRGAEPTLAQARTFQSRFDEGNDWVIKTFFPDHPEYLEPRWPKT